MTTTPREYNPTVPADAVEIIGSIVGRLRMDGLSGNEVAALIASLDTVRKAIAAQASEAPRG